MKFQPSYASEWGDNAHKHLELYIKAGGNYVIPARRHKDTGRSMRDYQWVADALLNRAAQRRLRHWPSASSLSTATTTPPGNWDKDAWLRGKIDVTIIYNGLGEAEVYDYRNPARRSPRSSDPAVQRQRNGGLQQHHRVKAGYIWLKLPKEQMIDKPIVYTRNDLWQPCGNLNFEQVCGTGQAYTAGVFPRSRTRCARTGATARVNSTEGVI